MAARHRSGKLEGILACGGCVLPELVKQDEQVATSEFKRPSAVSVARSLNKHGRVRELCGDAILAGFERASAQ